MKKRFRVLKSLTAGAFVLAAFLASPALAHHSFAMYETSKTETIKGQVREFNWANPHSSLLVVTFPEKGKPSLLWTIELGSPGKLTREGWTKRVFKTGDRVSVTFLPLRNGEAGGSFVSAVFLDTGAKSPGVVKN